MKTPHRVALLGFSDFERSTLGTVFRLAAGRHPSYRLVPMFPDCEFVIADADHAPSVKLVQAAERVADTVFIGARPPTGATAWMRRPIDPLHVLRELDAMTGLHEAPDAEGRPVMPEVTWQALPTLHPDDSLPAPSPTPRPVPQLAPLVGMVEAALGPGARAAMGGANGAAHDSLLPDTAPDTPSVLLVDDSALALRFLETRLEPWGLRCDKAAGSARAITLLAQRDYDYVFVDVELGEDSELDGLALCQHIRRERAVSHRQPRLLALVSAHDSEIDRVRGTLAGCDAYLTKPLQADDLQRLLRRQGLPLPPGIAEVSERPAAPRPTPRRNRAQ